MEFASYLAGERWSDHPSCTHPLLGQLARQINDNLSDGDRQRLVPLIPSVVGRRGDHDTWLTLPVVVASEVITEVPEETQRALAAGLLSAERLCADAGPDLAATRRRARAALDLAPGAVAWVEKLKIRSRITPRVFNDRSAPAMITFAVSGIVDSEAADRAVRLVALLETAIAACPAVEPATGVPARSAEVRTAH
jgi:hypothetical protein